MRPGRIRRIAAIIRDNPETYSQAHYCGTACCIAGHAVWEFGTDAEREAMQMAIESVWACGHYISGQTIHERAQELLGLPEAQANTLFSGAWTPRSDRGIVRAADAAGALMKLARTGVVPEGTEAPIDV